MGTLGAEAIDLATHAGLELDPWQQYLLENTCAVRDTTFYNPYTDRIENKWAAFEVGVVVSRQNGKGSYLEARELAGLFIFGERLIIHSAHQFDTSKEAFERLLMLIENTPDLDEQVMRVSRSHGEEGIEVRLKVYNEDGEWTGERKPLQRIRFRTRGGTKGGGRGFTADCLVLDEAMILGKESIRALMPTMSARPNGQMIYTGSAGDKQATQLGAVRARAMRGVGGRRLFYGEWSIEPCNMFCSPGCDEHDRLDDVRSWAISNPGMGIRVTVEAIEAEWDSIGKSDPEGFGMERCGVGDWPTDDDGWKIIDKDHWDARGDVMSTLVGRFAIGVDTSPDRSMSCIGVCGYNEAKDEHIEIPGNADSGFDHRPGVQWVVPRVLALAAIQKPSCVVIDPASQAGSFIPELEEPLKKLGVEIVTLNAREYAVACGDLHSGVVPRKGESATVRHMDQPPLNSAVAAVDTRKLADLWAWSKTNSAKDISPLCAVTLAKAGWKKFCNEPEPVAPWVIWDD